MARTTDTRALVRQAWTELFENNGEPPNDGMIREWLSEKVGSQRNSTVVSQEHQAIKREALAVYHQMLKPGQATKGMPPSLASEGVQWVNKLWAAAQEQAAKSFEQQAQAVQLAADERVAESQEQQRAADEQLASLVAESEQTQRDHDLLVREKDSELTRLHMEQAALRDGLDKAQRALQSASEELAATRAELLAEQKRGQEDRQSHVLALQQVEHRFDGLSRRALLDVDNARTEKAQVDKRLGVQQQKNASLERRIGELTQELKATKAAKGKPRMNTKPVKKRAV